MEIDLSRCWVDGEKKKLRNQSNYGMVWSHRKMNICQAVCQMVFNFNGIFFTDTEKIPWIWLVILPYNFWEIISNAIHWNLRILFLELSVKRFLFKNRKENILILFYKLHSKLIKWKIHQHQNRRTLPH